MRKDRRTQFISFGQKFTDILIIFSTLILCFLLSLVRLPGMEIANITPNWLVIWLAIWSINHSRLQGLVAAVCIALVLDSLTSFYPTHIVGLVLVAWLTYPTKKNIGEEPKSPHTIILLMLKIFFLVLLVEGIMFIQYLSLSNSFPAQLWVNYQTIGLSSALLSSLWTPFLYYPLNSWWSKLGQYQKN